MEVTFLRGDATESKMKKVRVYFIVGSERSQFVQS